MPDQKYSHLCMYLSLYQNATWNLKSFSTSPEQHFWFGHCGQLYEHDPKCASYSLVTSGNSYPCNYFLRQFSAHYLWLRQEGKIKYQLRQMFLMCVYACMLLCSCMCRFLVMDLWKERLYNNSPIHSSTCLYIAIHKCTDHNYVSTP